MRQDYGQQVTRKHSTGKALFDRELINDTALVQQSPVHFPNECFFFFFLIIKTKSPINYWFCYTVPCFTTRLVDHGRQK